jgi:FtsZ-binding cell division protein ZapB
VRRHKHTGLKDLFNAVVHAQRRQPAATAQLQQTNDGLRRTITELRHTNRQLTTKISTLTRIVHVLEVENQHLRNHIAGTQQDNLRFLHPPPVGDPPPSTGRGATTVRPT